MPRPFGESRHPYSTEKEEKPMGLNRNDMDSIVNSAFENIVWVLFSKQAQVAVIAPYENSYFVECYNSRAEAAQGCVAYRMLADCPINDVLPLALTFDQAREFAKLNDGCWGLALVDNKRGLLDKHWVR